MLTNPLKTWWKARRWFKFPKVKFYFGKYTCGLPVYLHDKWIHVWISDLMWKDKWYTPRHEFNPQIGVRFFKHWQLLITLTAPTEKGDDCDYWEQLLWTVFYAKNNIVIAKESWGWQNENGISSWEDKYLTQCALYEIQNHKNCIETIGKLKGEHSCPY